MRYDNAQEDFAKAVAARDSASRALAAQSADTGIDKGPGFWRNTYNNLKLAGRSGNGAAGVGASVLEMFGYGRNERSDASLTRENFAGTDMQFDQLASIYGSSEGRKEALAAVVTQFRKDGLGDFSEKSLSRLRKNPKAYVEAMKALSEVNQQEAEQWKGFYEGNIQHAVLKSTAPGVYANKLMNAAGQSTMTPRSSTPSAATPTARSGRTRCITSRASS